MMINSGQLISAEYQAQQQHLHETTEYGTMAQHYGPLVSQIVEKLEITHLLDYGCGRRMGLLKTLKTKQKMTYQGYDPGAGVPELATAPIPAQMVCCIDVLEHVEPEYLENVLDHLAHLTQEPIEWWLPKLCSRWDIQTMQKVGDHNYYGIFYAKPRIEAPNGQKLIT
jgi:hypothetical protein